LGDGNVILPEALGGGGGGTSSKKPIEYSIATLPPTLRQRQTALVVATVTLAAYGAEASLANLPLARIDSFIPRVMAITS
jgi:hypothetical protein